MLYKCVFVFVQKIAAKTLECHVFYEWAHLSFTFLYSARVDRTWNNLVHYHSVIAVNNITWLIKVFFQSGWHCLSLSYRSASNHDIRGTSQQIRRGGFHLTMFIAWCVDAGTHFKCLSISWATHLCLVVLWVRHDSKDIYRGRSITSWQEGSFFKIHANAFLL